MLDLSEYVQKIQAETKYAGLTAAFDNFLRDNFAIETNIFATGQTTRMSSWKATCSGASDNFVKGYTHGGLRKLPKIATLLTGHNAVWWNSDRTSWEIDTESPFGLTRGWITTSVGVGYHAISAIPLSPNNEKQSLMTVQLAAAVTHHAAMGVRARRRRHKAPPLTGRELDVLRWVAEGKTAWEVGKILKMSETTVRVYLENLRRKYGVATTIQVVVLALLDGNLFSQKHGSSRR